MTARKTSSSSTGSSTSGSGALRDKRGTDGARRPSMSTLVRALASLDAGDRRSDAGDRAGALEYYGSALDDCLREGLYLIAASVAQRMIARYPDVVRARLTLAVLSLAEGVRILSPSVIRCTCSEFEVYAQAAQAAGRERVAASHLRRFAETTESAPVRQRIAELLHQLGDAEGAESIYVTAYEEQEGFRAAEPLPGDQRSRWIELLLSPTGDAQAAKPC